MEARASPDKATPGRRRQGRGKPAPLKAYASENDAANYASSSHHGHLGHHGHHKTPQTPKKMLSVSPVPAESNSAQPGSKQRNRNHKPRPKHDPTSPNYQLSNNQSPPRTSPTSKAIASTPFAGATFHASPSPADLPIPSFLKSNSESPMVRKPRGVVPQPSPPATDSEVPTPQRPGSASQHRESPLDFMFRAHRLEKAAREQVDQTAGPASGLAGVMSPPHHTDTPLTPTSSGQHQNRRAYNRQSSGGSEIFEMDGTGGQPPGPAFSTPYQDRIKAARSIAAHSPTTQRTSMPSANASTTTEDPTEALKRFLFAPQSSAPAAPAAANSSAFPPHPRNAEPFPSSQGDGSAVSIQAMENDLRRILKLDVGGERPPTDGRLFTR
ncbi:hypothetical protein J3F83DRAFT_762138 [Trichoderma novae-zelandiae]